MIVTRKDGKWHFTALSCGHWWHADLVEGYGVRAGKVISQQLNKEQWDKWRSEAARGE